MTHIYLLPSKKRNICYHHALSP
uniref:Uncharacterized protein n=1 Tax=Arundo donax TaxID=35708 RepID=A0A0A9A7E9_ARUDO